MAHKRPRVPALRPLRDREPPAALDRCPPGGGVRACLPGRWRAEGAPGPSVLWLRVVRLAALTPGPCDRMSLAGSLGEG